MNVSGLVDSERLYLLWLLINNVVEWIFTSSESLL